MKNPWRGLASYEENDDYLFCGRDEETIDLVRLIDNNLFITLYGSSGIGKTSLLKAGVIPILRRRDYFPLYVRLSQEPTEISYAEAIVRKLESSGLKEEHRIEMEHADGNDRLYLWNYFATTRFFNTEGREVYPVIILDQFEEVFRDADKRKAEFLLQQIYLLLNDELEMPNQEGYNDETNYRFVASIREDFLFVLEDSIDEFSLDLYKNNRYRLRPMKLENAKEVVLIPGKDCIEENEKASIAERIVALAKRKEQGDIDTLLLSLVCASTFDKKAGEKISVADLSLWKNNPMGVYYQDAIRELSAKQTRFIQQHLIREDGSRKRVYATEVKAALGVSIYDSLLHGKNRMLCLTERGQVELMHDQLALAVFEERKGVELRRKQIKIASGSLFVLILSVFALLIFSLMKTEEKMLKNQSRYVAEKALKLIDEGDGCISMRLLLETLPKDLKHPNRPFTYEAEKALRYAVHNNSAILRGHSKDVNSASFNTDGKLIISASKDGSVRIWDAKTGTLKKVLRDNDLSVHCAVFSSKNDRIAISVATDKAIKKWDVETNSIQDVLRGHECDINSVSFSPNEKLIVSASDDNRIIVWNVETKEPLMIMNGHTTAVNFASFSPEGSRVVSASWDKTVRIWDIKTGGQLHVLMGHTDNVKHASFSPDGKLVVSASWDKTIKLWNAENGELLQSMEGHTDAVNYASFSPDGKTIISASKDKTLKIWCTETGALIRTLEGHLEAVNTASFSPDGSQIVSASADKCVRIWDISQNASTAFIGNPTDKFYSAIFCSNDRYIVSASAKVYDSESDIYQVCNNSTNHSIKIWDIESGTLIDSIDSFEYPISFWQIDSEGNQLKVITCSDDPLFYNLTINSKASADTTSINKPNQFLSIVQIKTPPKNSYDNKYNKSEWYSPDSSLIVSVISNNALRIFDSKTKTLLHSFSGHSDRINHVSFSTDNKYIASTSSDNTIKVWDIHGDSLLHSLTGHTDNITSTSFNPKYENIVSSSKDNSLRVWDSKSGDLLQVLLGHTQVVNSVSFSSNGKRIVSTSNDGTIRIWDFPPLQELIDQTRERFKDRPLTPEERRMYYLE